MLKQALQSFDLGASAFADLNLPLYNGDDEDAQLINEKQPAGLDRLMNRLRSEIKRPAT